MLPQFTTKRSSKAMNQLTKRETEIMNLFTMGLKPYEISQKLCISNQIVEASVSNIYKKLEAKLSKQTGICL